MALAVPSEKRLKRVLGIADELIDEATFEVILELQRAVENFSVRADAMLREAFSNPNKLRDARDAVAFGQQLTEALADAGLEEVAELYRERFVEMEQAAIEYFEVFDIEVSRAGIDAASLEALVELNEAEFLRIADKRLVAPIRNAVVQGVAGGRDRGAVLDEITGIIRDQQILTRDGKFFTDGQIETLVNDSYRRHYRATKAQKAEALDMQIVWFQGPLDDVTSPQCEFMLTQGPHGVPNMWLRDEFTADLHPDLKENPLIAGGHFGCRHTVTMVPLGFAESQGFEAPRSVPDDEEVEENAEDL